jgi:hypothetical protein
MSDDLCEVVLQAHKRSYQRALETAIRTDTALIFSKDGEIIRYKPPFRYKLVPIKPPAKRKRKAPKDKL